MKLKLFPFLVLLFLLSAKGIAQRSEQAKNLLDQVSAKIASFDNMLFDFSYVLENRQENIRQETKGNVTLAGERYKLNFQEVIQLFDGTKTLTVV
ncbi:MAG: outer membrane lipoprotein carrier protein LolA, partial [Flavobacteriaceae bacterium]